jgi:hypothetical protein
MSNDVLGIIITIILFAWIGLAVYSNIKKQDIKESIIEIREFILKTLGKK